MVTLETQYTEIELEVEADLMKVYHKDILKAKKENNKFALEAYYDRIIRRYNLRENDLGVIPINFSRN